MKYERFEDLPVWQAAADLAAKMFDWTQQSSLRGKGDLANQLQRAALSISNNIAEGFERGTTNELLNYLYIARGSAGEVRSMLCVMDRMPVFDAVTSEIAEMKQTCTSISRQIHGWAKSLQNSEVEGQRHLNDRSRLKYETDKRKAALNDEHQRWQADFEQKLKASAIAKNEQESAKKRNEEPSANGLDLKSEI